MSNVRRHMPITDDQALSAYLFSAQAEASAYVCTATVPNYAQEFERRYANWKLSNADALARGKEVAKAQSMDGENPPSIRHAAKVVASILEAMPEDDRSRRCNEVLSEMSKPMQSGAKKNEP